MAAMNPELAAAILDVAKRNNWNPVDLGTAISFETAGTFDPWKAGPTTKWGQHRGLLQWGEPQAKQYGVTKDTSVKDQMLAAEKYLLDRGVKPGAGLMDIYSAINAGAPGLYNRSDTAAGGTPGTVADKVNTQMGDHRVRAEELLGMRAPVGALATGQAAPAAIAPAAVPGAPVDITSPAQVGALAAAPTGVTADSLGKLSAAMGGGQKQEEFAPLQQLQMPQASIGQSAAIASALARSYGLI